MLKDFGQKFPYVWFAVYLAVGIGVAAIQPHTGASLWYPPIAIGLLFFLIHGLKFWPLILLAEFIIANYQYQQGVWVSAIVAGLTVCELSIAYGLLRWVRFDTNLERNEDLIRFGLVVTLATGIGAAIGCSLFAAFNLLSGGYWTTFFHWWLGDLTTSLCLLIPMLVLYRKRAGGFWGRIFPARSGPRGRVVLFTGALLLVVWLALPMQVWTSPDAISLRPIIFIAVIWSAIRFDRWLTAFLVIAINIVTVLTLWVLAPAAGQGASPSHMGVLDVQIYMIVLTFLGVGLSLVLDSERRLREVESLFQLAINNAPFPAMIHADDGEILLVNRAWSEITGYTLDDIPSLSSWTRKAYGADWQPVMAGIENLYDLSSPMDEGEFQVSCSNGELRTWDFSSMSLGKLPDGRKMAVSMAVDLTERKVAENKRQELEMQLRLKHKMEAVGYLAGGMAHNFNNNLAIILGNLELAQLRLAKDSKIAPWLENAKVATRRARDLVQKILSYSRTDSLDERSVRPAAVIEETAKLLKSTIPATVDLRFDIQPQDHRLLIVGDESQIQEVLINLCNNAVYAMGETGHLTISLEKTFLSEQDVSAQAQGRPGQYAKLCVRDDGCGIDPELLEKIFDPFFTTKELHEGAGMGLATVQGIVAQHRGFIKVDSTPGQGTLFSLYFPLLLNSEAEQVEAAELDLGGGTEHILLVDDEKMLVDMYEMQLAEAGYRVTAVSDSRAALAVFRSNAAGFDLVITDQTMPDLSGLDLVKEMLSIRPDLPTILFTGFSSKLDSELIKDLGIRALLMKPVDGPTLLNVIRQVLDDEEYYNLEAFSLS